MPRKQSSKANAQAQKQPAKTKPKPTSKQTEPQYSIEDVIEKATECINRYDFDMAQRYCQKALEINNESIKALELTGQVMMEIGNLDAAKQCYGRCVELQPDVGHVKYLYLGQMLNGEEALNCYRKAIDIMIDSTESQENVPVELQAGAAAVNTADTQAVSKNISSAYLSIAELYMTDLCDEENAEEECVSSINKAIEHDKTNPEGYQVLADYHLIKGEIDEAKTQIKKSISLWLPDAKALVDEEQRNDDRPVNDPIDCLPLTPDAQLKAAKTLIEVEEYSDATEVLELVLDQDDTLVDAWYLLGWANHLQGDDYRVTAKYYLNRCKEVAKKNKYEDTDVLEHVDELLQSLSEVQDEEYVEEGNLSEEEMTMDDS